MKHFVFFAGMLIAFGLISPATSFAQGPTPGGQDTCATAIGDTSTIQALVEAQLEPCATLLEIGAIADSTRPSGQGGWAVKAAFLTCSAQVDSSTFFVGQCPSAFAIDGGELSASSERGVIQYNFTTLGEDGTDIYRPQYLDPTNGEIWHNAHDTLYRSMGAGSHDYTFYWEPPRSGTFYVRVASRDMNGVEFFSEAKEVTVELVSQLQVRGNHPGSSAAQVYSEHADVRVANLPIYSLLGKEVGRTDSRGYVPQLPSGMYRIAGLSTTIIH